MALFEWVLLILAVIVLPPIIQAMFARREVPTWAPDGENRRPLVDRLAGDRAAERPWNHAADAAEASGSGAIGESDADSSLHKENTLL